MIEDRIERIVYTLNHDEYNLESFISTVGEKIKPIGYGKLQLIDFLYYCIKFD